MAAESWLCDPVHRGNDRFLNDVHREMHRYGQLTTRQRDAVVRNMRQPNRSAARATPATWEQVEGVKNGLYTLRLMADGRQFSYRIHTITFSRTASLVGKRVVQFVPYVGARAVNLGYLLTDGTLRTWRSWPPDEVDDGHIIEAYAREFLRVVTQPAVTTAIMLNEQSTQVEVITPVVDDTEDGLSEDVVGQRAEARLMWTLYCRQCNEGLGTSSTERRTGICTRHTVQHTPPPSPATSYQEPPRRVRRVVTETPAMAGTDTLTNRALRDLSENGTGEVR